MMMAAEMSIGMNLESVVDWSPAWVFTDAFKTSRPWISHAYNTATGGMTWEGGGTVQVDARGWPTQLNQFRNAQGELIHQRLGTLMFRDIGTAYPTGVYRAEWEGMGNLTWGFAASLIEQGRTASGANYALLNVVPDEAGIYMRIDSMSSSDPIRNVRVWMPDTAEGSFVGQVWDPGDGFSPFHPEFLKRLAPFKTLRFMDWGQTNTSDLTSWSQRRPYDYATQQAGEFNNGVAIDYMIELCNELDADGWFNMPHGADDDFVRNFATLVRDRLEPGRKAYIEWSNELWNSGWGFEAYPWVTEQLAKPENADLERDRWALVARETKRDFDIWSDVFAGQPERIVRVVAGQQANSWIAQQIADRMGGHFDAISSAAYMYVSDQDKASMGSSTTADQVLDALTRNLPTSIDWIGDHRDLAAAYSATLGRDIRFVAYEGGPHLDSWGAPYQQAFYDAGNHPRMRDVYGKMLADSEAVGLDLFLHFNLTGGLYPSGFGAFGALQSLFNPDTPKYQALLDAIGGAGPVNQPPTLAEMHVASFVEGALPVAVNPRLRLADLDNATLVQATVRLEGSLVAGEDRLAFVPSVATGNIFGQYDIASGVLTLSSTGAMATIAQFQAALRSVTYQNLSQAPATHPRAIRIDASDAESTSEPLWGQVQVSGVNDVPVLSGAEPIVFEEDGTPIATFGSIELDDADSSGFAWAKIAFASGTASATDLLEFVPDDSTGDIVGGYQSGTLTLLSAGGAAPAEAFRAAMRRVRYRGTNDNPSVAIRTLTAKLSDGIDVSSELATSLRFIPVNDAPILRGGNAWIYAPGQSATQVNPGVLLSDADHLRLGRATVRIADQYAAGQELLSFTPTRSTGNIAGSFDAATGTLTLSSAGATATVAQFQAALRGVRYRNTSLTPTAASRAIEFRVDDGIELSDALATLITIRKSGVAPTLGGIVPVAYTEQAAPMMIGPGVTLLDADGVTIPFATVQISRNYVADQDRLVFVPDATTGGIESDFNPATGMLTLIARDAESVATINQFQAALRRVAYVNGSANPSRSLRTITWRASDGTSLSAAFSAALSIVAVNDRPVLGGPGVMAYSEGRAATAINPGLTLSDIDHTTLFRATVRVTANYVAGQDVLGFVASSATGNIVGSFDVASGTLTLTSSGGTATVGQFQTALRRVTYRNSSADPATPPRGIEFVAFDASASSDPLPSQVVVLAVASAPLLFGGGYAARVIGGGDVVAHPSITVTDPDSGSLASATVTISGNYQNGQDVLRWAGDGTTGNIIGRFDTGVLTLVSPDGTATVSQFQAALRRVTYRNTSATPTRLTRTLSWRLGDAQVTAAPISTTITFG